MGWLQARTQIWYRGILFWYQNLSFWAPDPVKAHLPKASSVQKSAVSQPDTSTALEKDGSQKAAVLLQMYQSIASCSLPGKRVSLGVCKRLARLEGYTLLTSTDPTRNWTFCLFTFAEGWVEIKEGESNPSGKSLEQGLGSRRGENLGEAQRGVRAVVVPCCSIMKCFREESQAPGWEM